MTCNEIENLLPAYMEELLSPEGRKNIEEHLASCSRCSQALADLKKAEELMHGLEEVEPPPFFEQRIMAGVREEAGKKKGIRQKLFYPLYIKVPVQVMATVFVAVFAFYIYQKGEPEMKQAVPFPVPITENAKSQNISEPSGAASVPPTITPAKRAPAGDGANKKSEQPEIPRLKGDAEEKSMTYSPPPIRREQSSEIKAPAPIKETREKDMLPVKSKALNVVQDKSETQFGGASETLRMQQTLKGKATAKQSTIDLTMYVGHAPNAIREIEERLSRFNAKIIERQHREGEEILKIQIAGQNAATFLDQLKTIGKIGEGKSNLAVPDGNMTVIIKIEEH
jgi:hypothetical protein